MMTSILVVHICVSTNHECELGHLAQVIFHGPVENESPFNFGTEFSTQTVTGRGARRENSLRGATIPLPTRSYYHGNARSGLSRRRERVHG
jgi:hypothetical protein